MEMLINGRWTQAQGNERVAVSNPANGEVIDHVPEGTADDVRAAVDACQKGKREMAALPASERYRALLRIGDALRQQKDKIAEVLTRENGKPITQARAEVAKAGDIFTAFGEQTKRVLGNTFPMDSIPGCAGQVGMTIRQPLGVIAAIIPFNFPVAIFAHKVAPALAAGNAVIVKPPTLCPLAALMVAEEVQKAGFPSSAFHVLTGHGANLGQALVTREAIDMLSLTGGTATGKAIVRDSTTSIKRFCLELGGNDPLLIFDDANLEDAVNEVVRARLIVANGQSCYSPKRIILQRSIKDRFVKLLLAKTAKLKTGDPIEEETHVGPLVSETAAQEVEEIIAHSVSQGAKCLLGGKRFRGAFIEPTVLDDVTTETKVVAEETFGPVVPIMTFSAQEEAIEIANHSPYGLHGGVYTNDISRAFDVAYRLQAGGIAINGSGSFNPGNLPFSPSKQSGLGNEGLFNSIEEMTQIKSIVINHALSSFNTD